ncbi:MAG: hypothetical protein ACI35W_02765 [Anaeroplasmataceae bacterium]
MKKKIIITILLLSILLMFNLKTNASSVGGDYQKFSSITLCRGKLINNYTEEELIPYKNQTKKRMWIGWRIAYINKRVKCNFVSETIMSVYNTGTTAMKYKLQKVDSTVYKTSVSATGNIGTNIKGTVKKFSGGLESSLKIENQTSTTIEVKTTENMEIDIDPKTKVTMYLCGDGYLTNGYAKKYEWWIASNWGCFEYFEITNIYPRIVKVSI